MDLSDSEARWAYHLISEVMRRRRQTGEPIPKPVRELFAKLNPATRTDPDPAPPEVPDPIGSTTAAGLLGCTRRNILHLTGDLDGVRVDGRWLFSRKVVEEYAEARKHRPAQLPFREIPE
jgi:hypothetical protein